MSIGEIEYTPGTELPDLKVTWRDEEQVLIPFGSDPHTFSLRVGTSPAFIKGELGGTQPGITSSDTDPNVVLAWDPGELDAIPPGEYDAQLWARRTSDDKDRQPIRFTFRVPAAIF